MSMKKLTTFFLAVFILLIGKVDAATLTQWVGDGYIRTTVEEGQTVILRFNEQGKYKFEDWIIEGGQATINQTDKSITFTMPATEVVLRANYEVVPAQYSITYDANGGTGAMAPQSFGQGTSINLSKNMFSKSKYIFDGWSTSPTGKVAYKDQATVKFVGNTTLYAIWKPEPATMLPENSWYNDNPADITKITFVKEYTGSYDDMWEAAVDGTGSIPVYVVGNDIIISANGADKIYANPNSAYMFYHTTRLTIDGLDLLDTSKVTNMHSMFEDCRELTKLDVSNFDTSNVTDMSWMFYGCSSLTSLDTSNFDTSKVTDMSSMFSECDRLTSFDLSNFNTKNVTNMSYMFPQYSRLKEITLGPDFSFVGTSP